MLHLQRTKAHNVAINATEIVTVDKDAFTKIVRLGWRELSWEIRKRVLENRLKKKN